MKMSINLPNIGTSVAYHPEFTRFLGSCKASIFLAQLIYWEGKQKDPNGWMYKTRQELQRETALTRHEQDAARKILKEKGYIQEKLKQIPPKVHFKICWDKLRQDWKNYRINLPDNSKTNRERMEQARDAARQHITESTSENTHKNTSDKDGDEINREKEKKLGRAQGSSFMLLRDAINKRYRI